MTRLVLALLALLVAGPAIAADANDCGYVQGNGGWYKRDDRSGPYSLTAACTASLLGSGAGGGGGASAVTGSMEQDVRGSGTLSAASTASTIVIPVNGQSTVGMTFTGLTASGATVTFEQSNDGGTTYTGVNEVNAGTGVPSATRTTDGQTRVAVQGRTNLRLRVSTAGTGTISVAWNVSVREGLVTLASPLPPGTNAIGTFGLNGPIPAGANVIGAVTQSGGPWTVSGSVNVANFPATQPVSGAVAVSNFPTTQPVSGTVALGAGSASIGSVAVSNFPASTAVTDATVTIPLSATGTTTGFRVDGYGSLFIDIASLNATLTVQGSSDSTNGTDGTWTSLIGASADDVSTNPATTVSTVTKRRIYRIQDTGGWVRLNVTAITGSGSVYLTKRLAPLGERAVMIGGGTANVVPITSSNTGGIVVTSGISRLVSSAASTNATVAKSSGGRLYKVFACNTTTTAAFIKFYNVSAAPTVGTTPVVLSRPLPAASAAGGLACASYDMLDFGWFFSTGIAYAFTTGSADSDTTALAAGQVVQSSVEFQ